MSSIERFPLSWPVGWTRTRPAARRAAAFGKRVVVPGRTYATTERLSVGDGLDRLTGELRRLGASQVVISSNLRVRQDGLPYAQQAKVLDDPGVAVYFRLAGAPRCLACDRWSSAADNLAAIAGHIESIRAVDRYGVGTLEQAFAGYAALPPSAEANWWLVLGVPRDASPDCIDAAFKRLARTAHPDAGGSHDAMARLSAARDAGRQERQR